MMKVITGFGILAVAVLVLLANVVLGQDSGVFVGEVISIDDNVIEVEGENEDGEFISMSFIVNENTTITYGKDSISLDDLNVYDMVSVDYVTSDDSYIAVNIVVFEEDEAYEDEPSL